MLWTIGKLVAEPGPGPLGVSGAWIQWEAENSGFKVRKGRKGGRKAGKKGGGKKAKRQKGRKAGRKEGRKRGRKEQSDSVRP